MTLLSCLLLAYYSHFFQYIIPIFAFIYNNCGRLREGVIPKGIFWSLIFVNVVLNAFHGLVMAWADYPRSVDATKMAEIGALVAAEAGITDL
jgi:hypothetical protein